jgi:hypothetical protein
MTTLTGCLAAFLALYVDRCRCIVIGSAIGDCGIAVKRRTNQADVDFPPSRGVGTAIDVIADNVARCGSVPVQVNDMVSRGLDDDFIAHVRDMSAAACGGFCWGRSVVDG